MFAGLVPDRLGIIKQIKEDMAQKLTDKVKADFLRKSQGQPGEDGIQWAPLKPATIARKLSNRGLSREQKKKFQSEYQLRVSKLIGSGVPRDTAVNLARNQAFAKLNISGGTGVSILIEKGDLYESFEPRIERGSISVVNTDRKAIWHHEGRGRLPARRLWGEDGLPASWWVEIVGTVGMSLARGLGNALRGKR